MASYASPDVRRPGLNHRGDAHHRAAGRGWAAVLGLKLRQQQRARPAGRQKIYFPPKGSPALAPPEIGRHLDQYAGQQLVNGAQAKAYADHFIAVHLNEAAGGKTYAQISSQA